MKRIILETMLVTLFLSIGIVSCNNDEYNNKVKIILGFKVTVCDKENPEWLIKRSYKTTRNR